MEFPEALYQAHMAQIKRALYALGLRPVRDGWHDAIAISRVVFAQAIENFDSDSDIDFEEYLMEQVKVAVRPTGATPRLSRWRDDPESNERAPTGSVTCALSEPATVNPLTVEPDEPDTTEETPMPEIVRTPPSSPSLHDVVEIAIEGLTRAIETQAAKAASGDRDAALFLMDLILKTRG